MELRKSEETVQELLGLYESIRLSPVWSEVAENSNESLPRFVARSPPTLPPLDGSKDDANTDGGESKEGVDTRKTESNDTGTLQSNPTTSAAQPPPTSPIADDVMDVVPSPDMDAVVEALNRIQSTIVSLQPRMDRFRKRLAEKDPVTNKPRYGGKTQYRVQVMMDGYDFLVDQIPLPSENEAYNSSTPGQNILLGLQQHYLERKTSEQRAKEKAEQERQRLEEQARQKALRHEQLEAQRAREAAELEYQEQAEAEAELRRQAEAARQRRLAQERAEQEWVDSISKGPQGVQSQLDILKESTKDDPEAQTTAIKSLHTIFQQINAHPEETNFRRIRRDHEKFTQDIGRHKGGVEFLIAAGFELGAIDDVPCYISKEPNIETNMDGWSAWFDLLKATLEILEREVIELPKVRK